METNQFDNHSISDSSVSLEKRGHVVVNSTEERIIIYIILSYLYVGSLLILSIFVVVLIYDSYFIFLKGHEYIRYLVNIILLIFSDVQSNVSPGIVSIATAMPSIFTFAVINGKKIGTLQRIIVGIILIINVLASLLCYNLLSGSVKFFHDNMYNLAQIKNINTNIDSYQIAVYISQTILATSAQFLYAFIGIKLLKG